MVILKEAAARHAITGEVAGVELGRQGLLVKHVGQLE
jgi:hypothetical protein